MLLRLILATGGEEEPRPSPWFHVSELAECPRKVLLRRAGAEGLLPPPPRLLVRRVQGLAMEAALERLLARALPQTNRVTFASALLSREDLAQDLGWAITSGRLRPEDVRPWGVAQFPFRRVVEGVELHGRADYLLLLFSELCALEVKQVGLATERRTRAGDLPPGFLLQAGAYAHFLRVPCYLQVFSPRGEAEEHLFLSEDEAVEMDGRPARIGDEPVIPFLRARLLALAQASLADFPLLRLGPREWRLALPEGFPAHPEDAYGLVLGRDGKPKAEIQRKGQKKKSFRCPYCPYRGLCYPELRGKL